jgi:hypothetical protein
MLAGVGFSRGEPANRIAVPPGKTVLHHFAVDEPLAQVDAAHLAMIPVYTDGRTSRQAASPEFCCDLHRGRPALSGDWHFEKPPMTLRALETESDLSRTPDIGGGDVITAQPTFSAWAFGCDDIASDLIYAKNLVGGADVLQAHVVEVVELEPVVRTVCRAKSAEGFAPECIDGERSGRGCQDVSDF